MSVAKKKPSTKPVTAIIKSNNGSGGVQKLPVVPFREFKEMVVNAMTMRQEFLRRLTDPRRDIAKECGHPDSFSAAEYKLLYARDPIACRVVQLMPLAVWQQPPKITEQQTRKETPFKKAFTEVGKSLRGRSWFESETINPLWEYCRRADEVCGIGSYGVILLGIKDGKTLDLPVDGVDEFGRQVTSKAKSPVDRKLLFLQCFDESCASITKYETDPRNPRYGLPVEYLLTFNSLTDTVQGQSASTATVHWTRIIHIPCNVTSSEVFGTPRMRPVLNRLLDLGKLYGGSAEMFWKAAFMGLSIESVPGMDGMALDIDEEDLKAKINDYQNGLQRYLALIGLQAKSLAPQVSEPTSHIDIQVEAICIQLNVPKRKFTGSERGELASSEDDGDWNDSLRGYQNSHSTPRIAVPLTDRLIMTGCLPQPTSYGLEWPELETMNEIDKATVLFNRTNSMSVFIKDSVEALMDPLDYLTREMGYTKEEAEAILEASDGALADKGSITGSLHELTKPPAPIIAGGLPGQKPVKGLPAPKAPVKGKKPPKGKK